MRRLAMIAAIAAFVGCGGYASAADLSMKDTFDAPVAPVWSGLYIGGHLGGLWTGDDKVSAKMQKCSWWKCEKWKEAEHVQYGRDDDDSTFVGGVHVGYNWQMDSRVFGIEGDIDFADDIDYLATLRARLGYASGNFLLYATAGVAFAGFDDKAISFSTPDYSYSLVSDDDDRRIGFVVGGGVEYKLRANWSVGVEGLYYRFADEFNQWGFSEGDYCRWKNYLVKEDEDNDLWTVRGRLTYHFTDNEREVPLK